MSTSPRRPAPRQARYRARVRRNLGGRRAFVACSKAKASRSSLGSDQAVLKKEIPTGNPNTWPAGTVMLG